MISNLNKTSLIVGVILFIVAALMFFSSSIIFQTTVTFPIFLVCAALGIIMAAIGGEARVTNPTFTIAGSGAIAVILFGILMHAIKSGETRYIGSVEIRAADPQRMLEMTNAAQRRPTAATLRFVGIVVPGVLRRVQRSYMADFSLSGEQALNLREEKCPSLDVEMADRTHASLRFRQVKMIPADYQRFFGLDYLVDKNKIYYLKDEDEFPAENCDGRVEREIDATARVDADERNISAKPAPVTPPPPPDAAPRATPSPPIPSASASASPPTPAGSARADAAPSVPLPKVIGYIVFSRLSADFKDVKNTWFEVASKPGARFPVPNDVVTATTPRSVYAEPFRWDAAKKKHIVPKSLFKLEPGQKAKVGGDAIIAHDETIDAQYVISPIVEVIGHNAAPEQDAFPPATLPPGIKGYAYLGYLDEDGSAYSDRTFNNYSRPDSLYPLPGDTLLATSNVWLRAGPRRWDATKQDYVNAPTVTPILAGQYVKIGGDTVLAKGGSSVWAPVSEIVTGGLAELASKQP